MTNTNKQPSLSIFGFGNQDKVSESPTLETYNLDKFHFIEGNRRITPHYKNIKSSVKMYGLVSPVVVVWNKTLKLYEILDGQHRIEAVLELNEEGIKIPLKYIVNDNKFATVEDKVSLIQSINTVSRNWSIADIIDSRSKYSVNKESYIYLIKLLSNGETTADKISTSIALRLVSGLGFGKTAFTGTSGLLKADNLHITEDIYHNANSFLNEMQRSTLDKRKCNLTLVNGKSIWNREYFIRAWFILRNKHKDKGFSKTKFFEQFSKNIHKYRYDNSVEGTIKNILEIYNFGLNKKNKIELNAYGD